MSLLRTKRKHCGNSTKRGNRLRSSFCKCVAETHPTISQRAVFQLFSLSAYLFSLTSDWSVSWVVSSYFLSLVRTIILAPVYCSFGTRTFSLLPCCYHLFSYYSSSPSRDICSWTFTSYLIPLFFSAILISLGITILPQIVHPLIFHFQ